MGLSGVGILDKKSVSTAIKLARGMGRVLASPACRLAPL